MRIAREQQFAEVLLGRRDVGERPIELGLDEQPVVRVDAGQQLLRGLDVVAARPQGPVGGDDRFELAVALGHLSQLVGVGRGGGVGQARLQLAELVRDGGETAVETGIEHDDPRLSAGRNRKS